MITMKQNIITIENNYQELDIFFQNNGIKTVMLVCGSSYKRLNISKYFEDVTIRLGINIVFFSDFQPNPEYDSVVQGVSLFNEKKCDAIIAVGGGSAMDVAKCIKLFATMDSNESYLKQTIEPNDIKYLAIPTTAGTGSEATRYAVIYHKGEKQSITDSSCIPSTVVFDISALKSLPEYQKKVTMLDALCHSLESFWSVNSTDESKEYSKKALKLILDYFESYISNEDIGNEKMLLASNYAGKAIDITQTTAGHAMCYKLTSMYKIPHGHAVALCVKVLWKYMVNHTSLCIDSRGKEYLDSMFLDIAKSMNCKAVEDAIEKYDYILERLNLSTPDIMSSEDFNILKSSVNIERLNNNPVKLTEDVLEMLYHQILDKKDVICK